MMLASLGRRKPAAQANPLTGGPQLPPAYAPTSLMLMASVHDLPQVPLDVTGIYDRGITAQRVPLQTPIIRNSEADLLERGPIRNVYVREWWWRNPYAMDDRFIAEAHLLPADAKAVPGGVLMSPRPVIRFAVHSPAWTINSGTMEAQGGRG